LNWDSLRAKEGSKHENIFSLFGIPENLLGFFLCFKIHFQKSYFPAARPVDDCGPAPENMGKKLVDMTVTALKALDLLWADYVLISAMVVQKESVRKVINRCKTLKVKTVAGGPLFTCEPDEFRDVDHKVYQNYLWART
jgi:hypothetical protein